MGTFHSQYPVEVAMADVVQRCVESGARRVDVAVEFAGASSWIRVVASGGAPVPLVSEGMPRDARTGLPLSPRGLDLLAACLSQGRRVTVDGGVPVAFERDGDSVVRVPAAVSTASGDDACTVVVIEGLHEVHAYKRIEGRVVETAVVRMRARLVESLGLAFHRRLAVPRGALALTVNLEPVLARDPFAAPPSAMVRGRPRELPFVAAGRVQTITATPCVLTPRAGDRCASRQGFFVYLRDCLVQSGGWSRLNISGRDDALVRIAVDLPASGGDSFGWEAAARRVRFPTALGPALHAVALEAAAAPAAHGGVAIAGCACRRRTAGGDADATSSAAASP